MPCKSAKYLVAVDQQLSLALSQADPSTPLSATLTSSCPKLSELFVMSFSIPQGNKFDSAKDIEPYLEGLKDGTTKADFGGSSYGVEATKAIADKLASINTLEVANLDDMFTGRDGDEIAVSMTDLLEALENKPKLHTVNLSDNAFGIVALKPLDKFLRNHAPLEHLIFANNGFGPHSGATIGNALTELAAVKSKHNSAPLRTVVCGRNRLEAGSMEAWAKFLKAHGTIEEIRLYQNGIRIEGIEQLMREGLAHSPKLRKLDLTDNTFTEVGSNAMADVIHNWPEIESIEISDCLLSSKGSKNLTKKLGELDLKSLKTLKLQYNEIDEKGLEHLKDAISKSIPNLELLELNGNRFSEDHPYVLEITELFGERGVGELDELDDMEELDSDEEEEADSDDELDAVERDAEYAEDEPAPGDKSDKSEADDLAKALEKELDI